MDIPLIHTPCDICGSEQTTPEFDKSGFTGVRCSRCGLVFIRPRPDSQYLEKEVYNEGYFNAERGYGIEDIEGRAKIQSKKRALSLFDEIEKTTSKGTLLDIGCAAGYFLEEASRRGWTANGVEISKFAAEKAGLKNRFNIYIGDFINLDIPANKFDLVLMLDLIEHLTSPVEGLKKAFAALKPGGLLVIETPNYESAPSKVLGKEWGLIAPEHHLFYFTPKTLTSALETAGFTIREMKYPRWGLADLLFSAGSFKKVGLPIGDKEKKFVRSRLKGIRDTIRSAADIVDKSLLVPLSGNSGGVTIRAFAIKPTEEK